MLQPGRTAQTIWLGYWLLLFVLTHIPAAPPVPMIRQSDKVLHAVAYFVLTLLGGWSAGSRATVRYLLLWAAVYAAYAAVDELLQQFTARTPSLGDWVADVIGVALATAVLIAIQKRPEISENAD